MWLWNVRGVQAHGAVFGFPWQPELEVFDVEPVLDDLVVLPDGHDADRFREIALDRFDLSLGSGLARLKGRVFRIGHLGDLNDLTVAGTLAGVESGLQLAGVPIQTGGVEVAMRSLVDATA